MNQFLLLSPAGTIAGQERHIIILAVSLMLLVAIPMFIVLFTFARKYRADNPNARRLPTLDHNGVATFFIWAIPITLITVLSFINWNTTHELDPSLAIASNVAPIQVQVIALPWKFLFIYPAQGIATVNLLEFPENTPLHFELTADAPMSSFWIPQLGSQIYAMPAMSTQLNLIANEAGDFEGMDTEINGVGFSGMKFVARSVSQNDFDAWVASVRQGDSSMLDLDAYNQLAAPSENNPEASYASVDENLYTDVIMKYMVPSSTTATGSMDMNATTTMPNMPSMQM